MGSSFNDYFSFEYMGKPYEDNSQYIADEFRHKCFLIEEYINCSEKGDLGNNKDEILKKFYTAEGIIKSRLRASDKDDFFAGRYIKEVYGFNEIQWFCFVISAMYRADSKYKNMLLKIEKGDFLTYGTILKIYFFVSDITFIPNYYDILSVCEEKMNAVCFMSGNPQIDERVFENVMSNAKNDISVAGLSAFVPDKEYFKKLDIRENIALDICGFLKKCKSGLTKLIHIYGENGIGKKSMVSYICTAMNRSAVFIDLSKTDVRGKEFTNYILTGCREALFLKGYICFYNAEKSKEKLLNLLWSVKTASKFSDAVFVLSNEKILLTEEFSDFKCINTELPELTCDESFKIWKISLENTNVSKNINIRELSNKFIFTPGQIKNAVDGAVSQSILENKKTIDESFVSRCAYGIITSNLSNKATLIKKKHTWDELVLNASEKEIIKQACNQIKYKHIVYDEWGMNSRILYGKGLSMLFAGPSGTGKTMAAQVVANELGLEIYKVDLSKVVSKYIGESEKNLGEVFDSAKKSNVILLFDETDALFGKRTEVRDSHDKHANLETSYLLQKMEEYSGITIMTTNFIENIDKAFFRRINYVVHFAFPKAEARKEIWEKMFPKEMPVSKDVNFKFLANRFEIAGGSIKNTVLTSAFMAACESKEVSMKHIVKSLEYELKKQGKMITKDDFAEYGYLI